MLRLPSLRLASWWRALAVGLLVGACGGPTTSLDTTPTTGSTTEGPDTGSTGGSEGTTGEPPPQVTCASECASLLQPTWSYEGAHGYHAVVEMLRDPDGAVWLGTQQQGGTVGLMRLTAEGELEWSIEPGMPCENCRLGDLARHPSGDLLLSVTEPGGVPRSLVGRVDVVAREVAWIRSLTLNPGNGTQSRAGELAVLEDERVVQLRVDALGDDERFEVLDFDAAGGLRRQRGVLVQPGSGSDWTPLAAPGIGGELVTAHAWWDEEEQRMRFASSRLVPPSYTTLSSIPLPLPLDDLAVDGAGRRLELARSRGPESVTLRLTSRRSSDPERFTVSLPLVSTSSTRAALAVGPDDDVYAAARTTPRLVPGEAMLVPTLAVARWSPEGRLRWSATQPLDIMATSEPVELVVDDDGGVIVGTVTQGRLLVVRYEHACACD